MKNPFLNRRFSFTYAFVWLVIIITQIAVLHIIASQTPGSAILQSIISNLSFALLGFGIWFVVKYNLVTSNPVKALFGFLFAGIIVVSLWMGFNFIIQNLINKIAGGAIGFVNRPFYQFTTGVFFYTIFVLLYRMLILFHNLTEKAKSEEKLQKLLTETKLHALKAYINPHFLFNSLNSVSALISTNPEKAREMLVNLSEYFRYSLKQKDNNFISLKDELHYSLTYFEIEKQRFGDKIQLNLNIENSCEQTKVPVMILQPLFENIIKHAVSESLSNIIIDFNCKIENQNLIISIENNYDEDAISKRGTGIGLATTRDRLELIYNQKGLMNYSKNNGIFTIVLNIPTATK